MNAFFGCDVINTRNNVEKVSRLKQVKIDGVLSAPLSEKNPLRKRIFAYKDGLEVESNDSFDTKE